MKWHTQTGNITTNMKVKIYLTLLEFSTTKIVTWECHMYESTKVRYNMILGIYVLKALRLIFKYPNFHQRR